MRSGPQSELSYGECVSRIVSSLCLVLVLMPKPVVDRADLILKEMIEVVESVLNSKETLSVESFLTFLSTCKKQRKVRKRSEISVNACRLSIYVFFHYSGY